MSAPSRADDLSAPAGVKAARTLEGLDARFVRMAWYFRHPVLSLLLTVGFYGYLLSDLDSPLDAWLGLGPWGGELLWFAGFLVFCLPFLQQLRRLNPLRVSLTPHRLLVADSADIPLESIRFVEVEPRVSWFGLLRGSPDRSPAALRIRAATGEHLVLDGVKGEQLRWLAGEIRGAIAQRKSALLAAGYEMAELGQPPAEAERLKAMARRAGEPS